MLGRFRIPSGSRLVVFPPDGDAPRQFRVPGWAGVVFAALAVLVTASLGHYAWLMGSGAGFDALDIAKERELLRRENAESAREAERMAEQIEGIEFQMRRLAVLAGAEPVERPFEGVGGAATAGGFDYVSERMEELSSRIARLDEQGVALERLLEEKSRLIASTPTVWPVRGYISSRFGRRPDPFTGEIEWHQGLDVSTSVGVPVRSTAEGFVLSTGRSPTYGMEVAVSHGFGMVTRYAHLSRIDVREGQQLRRGQVLGAVGNTGRSRGPHLHYEVWLNGKAQDPLLYIVDYAPAPLPG